MKGITGNPALDAYQRMSAVSPARPAKPTANAQAAAGTGEAARVSISREARELAGGAGPGARRVDELKAALANGTFEVDAMLVAQRIVDTSG